ncbi:MAG: glycosyltransferase family 1 protein [Ruminococcaceae bacterium]|nr:glycosyltransferase family 1 protein [Oscillospiraceae bacterium]
MSLGGLETLIMNVFRNIDREKVQFDFLVHRKNRAEYDDEIEKLGGRIYRLPRLNPFNPGYYRALDAFFREHPEYRIVHCHQDCLSAIPLAAAQKAGVPVRIAHSHTTSQDKNLKYLIKRYYMTKIPETATHFFACSRAAGEWMFPDQTVRVVNNGIDTAQFSFDPEVRNAVRRELGLQNELVLGHVGNFAPTKNHSFLLDIFKSAHELQPDTVLLLVGNGSLDEQIRAKAKALGFGDAVRFLGLRTDVNRLYQAMDVFVMPSLYEGFGIAAIEAQAAGLRCMLADTIPPECKVTDGAIFCKLQEGADAWAEEILRDKGHNRAGDAELVKSAGYDIQGTASWLQEFYLENG